MAKKRTQYRDAMEYMQNDDIDLSGNGNPFSMDPEIEIKENDEKSLANAALIALAPEMLEALELVLRDTDGCRFCDSGRLRNKDRSHDASCGFHKAKVILEKLKAI